MTLDELIEQRKSQAKEIVGKINAINVQINELEKTKQELLTEAVKNNGALEALNQLKGGLT